MLCELCQKVGLPHASYKKHKDDTGYHSHLCIYRHHKTYVDLVNSATLGCELCALFRPFIEHAQLREAGLVEVAESECSNTDYGSDVTRADPFLFEDEDNLSEEDYESEDGDDGFGEDSSDDKAEEIENASVRSQRSSNFQEDIENKTHEVLEWLFLITDDLTGPEQLWLIAESGGKEQDDQTKSSGSLTTLTLSAGSIDNVHLDFNDSEYCLDGRYIGSRQSLAVVVPGLWKWHRKWLNILAGRKRPLRSLRPIFEYFQHRG
jgi:hypothetical protein